MPQMRKCPWCGGKHRTAKAARKCHDRKKGAPAWTAKEVGR